MIPIDVKKMSYEELGTLKEAIFNELELRQKEELNKRINNFKDAWRALEEIGIDIRLIDIRLDDGNVNDILNLEDIYYM